MQLSPTNCGGTQLFQHFASCFFFVLSYDYYNYISLLLPVGNVLQVAVETSQINILKEDE